MLRALKRILSCGPVGMQTCYTGVKALPNGREATGYVKSAEWSNKENVSVALILYVFLLQRKYSKLGCPIIKSRE